MSGWVNGEIVRWADRPIEGSPGWVARDCGCCNGIEWGGCEPIECYECLGSGWIAVHLVSGTVAEYPGGPLRGSLPKEHTP